MSFWICNAKIKLRGQKKDCYPFEKGVSAQDIHKCLEEETFVITKQILYWLIQKFKRDRVIVDLLKRKWPYKITSEMLEVIDSALKQNDELTSQ